MSEKKIMLGNEAYARGAWEAGVKVSAAYPGTPSTEISENLAKYSEVYAEWSPNEKVAAEVAIGASISGVRALASMKHVGLNVAADPLYTAAYTGVGGGLVLIVADDPGMYSSQNEQDTRMIGRAANVPVLEPSDSHALIFYQLKPDILIPFGRLRFPVAQFDMLSIWHLTVPESHLIQVKPGNPILLRWFRILCQKRCPQDDFRSFVLIVLL